MRAGGLVFPALRWSPDRGYGLDDPALDRLLESGVGGFLFFGGEAAAATDTVRELRERAGRPLLFGADLERGAGQQFRGATPLPPALALAGLGPEVVREAAAVTAREARAMGVDWLYAPVADVAVEPDNPIVGTRALGRTAAEATRGVSAWIAGAAGEGALTCAKHFPGHGRTLEDSHATLPTVHATAAELDAELEPFRAALAAGVPSVMTAHVAYPALDPSGRPATRSRAIITGLLRERLGFQGVVASDALIMQGVGDSLETAVVEAVGAGVDVLLYPPDPVEAARAVERAVGRGELHDDAVEAALARVADLRSAAGDGREPTRDPASRPAGWGRVEDLDRARAWARSCVRVPEGWPDLTPRAALAVVDDDLGGPWPPPARDAFLEALGPAGIEVDDEADRLLIAVFAEPRGWKGRAALSEAARARVATLVAEARTRGRPVGVVLFGDPLRRIDLPDGVPVTVAWGGEPLMQEAAASLLAGRR